ncbi:mitosis initiation protein fs(1)Ya [Drosophila innubila]|uniref:mitosis initiation protein fs(1)Ya n=1 Tax=Drosophila innubila TaxID=198719 RepID=UPI00148B4453|nr:mitosis initiation protein fs(1)Ya [Drosophila innubila]
MHGCKRTVVIGVYGGVRHEKFNLNFFLYFVLLQLDQLDMRFMDEAKCRICKRIFCCAKCRQKHQFDMHAIAVSQPMGQQAKMDGEGEKDEEGEGVDVKPTTIYVFCPICEQKPLTLREEMYAELLAHIESVHLPLRCRKCQRQYTKIDDLLEFSKCVDLAHNCSAGSLEQNRSCDTDASKVTVKKATVAANTISTQTSPSIAKDLNETQHYHQQQHLNLTPISLFNLRWKAKSRLAQEEFSVSSIRNLSSDSVNLSGQQRRSIGQLAAPPDMVHQDKGKIIRSTSTPLQVCSVIAKPKEALTFNATGSGTAGSAHLSSIYHSGYVLDEHNTPAAITDNSHLAIQQPPQQPQQRPWKVSGRGKMSAVTPLRQVMSKSIQKAFVEHGIGMLATQATQRRIRLDLSENNTPDVGSALDLRLSPVVRRTQSEASMEAQREQSSTSTEPYQILLSAQKLTTESIIITRTQHGRSGSLPVSVSTSTTNASTTSTVYNSCESVEIITSSTAELSANLQQGIASGVGVASGSAICAMPPITPITRIPGAVINKKLIKFETPHKIEVHTRPGHGQSDESIQEEKEIFYTPNPSTTPTTDPGSPTAEATNKERRRQQIVPRQLSGQFSPKKLQPPVSRPLGPRARPPLRVCYNQKAFSCVQDVESDDEVFLPNSASTHNDKKSTTAVSQSEPGRLWSLMSSVMRLPATLKTDRSVDKENTSTNSTSGSLIRRCASIAGSLVRTIHSQDDAEDIQSMKRKRTQTLDNQYRDRGHTSPASSSKRLRIQPRKPIERMRNNY